jgi:hypothetical protein
MKPLAPLLLAAFLAAFLAGCTAEARECDLIRPQRGGALTAEAVEAAAPAYSLAELRIRRRAGSRPSPGSDRSPAS